MRKNMINVIEAFKAGKSCSEKSCSTDGVRVYSYQMIIAEKVDGAVKVVPVEKAPSNTTRSQIYALRQAFPEAATGA